MNIHHFPAHRRFRSLGSRIIVFSTKRSGGILLLDGRRIHIGADKDIGVDKSTVRFVREKAPIRAGSFSDPGRNFFYSRGFFFVVWLLEIAIFFEATRKN